MFKTMSQIVFVAFVGLFSSAVFGQKNAMVKPRPVAVASEWKPHLGFLIGAAQPESSGVTASELGFDIGFQPYVPFGLGVEISHAQIDTGQTTQERNIVWGKGSYNFGGTTPVLKDSYVGVALGAVFKPNGTSLALAPLLGFDIPVKNMVEGTFSLGANAKYAIVGDNELDTLTVSGVLKYWY